MRIASLWLTWSIVIDDAMHKVTLQITSIFEAYDSLCTRAPVTQ